MQDVVSVNARSGELNSRSAETTESTHYSLCVTQSGSLGLQKIYLPLFPIKVNGSSEGQAKRFNFLT